jgi:hypothetical protein
MWPSERDVSRESATMLQVITTCGLNSKIDTINEVFNLVFGFIIVLMRFRDTKIGAAEILQSILEFEINQGLYDALENECEAWESQERASLRWLV